MSQSTGKDRFTPHTRPTDSSSYVSPMASTSLQSRNSPRNPAQSVLSNTIIPRDYLSSLSKSRSNATPPLDPRPNYNSDSGDQPHKPTLPHEPARGTRDHEQPDGRDLGSQDAAVNVGKTRQYLTDEEQVSTNYPESPRSFASSNTSDLLLKTAMPRTSSIDSAISSISNSSWPQKPAPDPRDPPASEVRNLIATAGSAENLILHLLRDKSHAAAQNAQLWKLVDKQRALLLGLNKDLERMTKERDRYRKKAKDVQGQHLTDEGLQKDSQSTPITVNQYGEKPYQNNAVAAQQQAVHPNAGSSRKKDRRIDTPVDQTMMPSPLQLQQQSQQQQHFAAEDRKAEQFSGAPRALPDFLNIPPPAEPPSEHRQQLPKLQSLTTHLAQPTFSLIEATPVGETPARALPPNRKAPPKPLDLKHTKADPKQRSENAATNAVDQDSDLETPLSLDRGRRKTREEDDKEREAALLQEQEARSRSKKEKRLKAEHSQAQENNLQPIVESDQRPTTPQQQPSARDHLSPPITTDANPQQGESAKERLLSAPLRSPGLPASPRPVNRSFTSPLPTFMTQNQTPVNSLPMSPRANITSFPLSPRAPKQALPTPTNLHIATIPKPHGPSRAVQPDMMSETDRLHVHESPLSPSDIPSIYRGLVSSTWPDLLLPPNAIPSIQVKVASSRLRPSRNSVFGVKTSEDSTVFSLSIFSRSSRNELWRIEKIPAALPQLEQQLRPTCPSLPKLPDRKLFSGHSPAVLDSRRGAIDTYFDGLLDTHLDEQGALIICKFLSTDVLDPGAELSHRGAPGAHGSKQSEKDGKRRKVGYLTKKGKNFGGWKSRYFVLDSPELRYFEAPGGAHLGTIKLLSARIGRQTQIDAAALDDEDMEGQFRHAFLVLEPKRKDSNSYVRHVLCAENDTERDEWVEALLHFVDEKGSNGRLGASPQPPNESSGAFGNPRTLLRGTDYGDVMADSANKSSSPTLGQSGSDSPTSVSSAILDPPTQEPSYGKSVNISGPINGGFIADAGLWGNKNSNQSGPKERDQKIRNLFHFNKKPSNEQLNSNHGAVDERGRSVGQGTTTKSKSFVRPVFGLSLAEAVEFCPPENVDILLPAVVYRCIEYLQDKHASSEEGLFRLSGSNIVIRSLKERFNTEGDVDLVGEGEYWDVHAVASLFKTYLRELPSSILTRDLHIEFLKVLEFDDRAQKIAAFNTLVHRLPSVNYSLLRTLSQYLLEVVSNSETNKMSVKNVGIVFSPTLNIPAPVFSMFLTDFDAIFNGGQQEEHKSRTTELVLSDSVNDQDIRSPRHQMYTDLSTPNYQPNFPQHVPSQMNSTSEAHRGTDYHMDANADFGFAPVQPSYESRNYVSIPSQLASQHLQQQTHQPTQKVPTYRMLAPDNTTSAKAKRRESAMLFLG